MTEAQIKHMVDRFLGWRLPENFSPDAGISFKRTFNENTAYPMKHEPTGTNLFDATQADALVRYLIQGMPFAPLDLLHSPEYARLCGIAAAAGALASVYPLRCTAPPAAKHPEQCHCGQVLLERTLSVQPSI